MKDLREVVFTLIIAGFLGFAWWEGFEGMVIFILFFVVILWKFEFNDIKKK